MLGVLFINNVNESQKEEISSYINNFVYNTQDNISIDYTKLFINSIKNKLFIALVLWFSGLTLIGIFAVYGTVCFKGFCLGYSISSIIASLGTKSGIIFAIASLLVQNIVFIPIVFALAISRNKII